MISFFLPRGGIGHVGVFVRWAALEAAVCTANNGSGARRTSKMACLTRRCRNRHRVPAFSIQRQPTRWPPYRHRCWNRRRRQRSFPDACGGYAFQCDKRPSRGALGRAPLYDGAARNADSRTAKQVCHRLGDRGCTSAFGNNECRFSKARTERASLRKGAHAECKTVAFPAAQKVARFPPDASFACHPSFSSAVHSGGRSSSVRHISASFVIFSGGRAARAVCLPGGRFPQKGCARRARCRSLRNPRAPRAASTPPSFGRAAGARQYPLDVQRISKMASSSSME